MRLLGFNITRSGIKRGFGVVRSFAAGLTPYWLAGWKWDGGFSNKEIMAVFAKVRGRSNDMFKNSAHYRRFIYLSQTNIVGSGFVFKSTPHDGFPGSPNYKLDRGASAFIEYHYKRWAQNPNWCDVAGDMNINEIDKLNVKLWKRDGEYFMLLDRNAQNPYGFAVQTIRASSVDHRFNTTLKNGNIVIMGIEFNPTSGRALACYVGTDHNNADYTNYGTPLRRYSKADFIHGFTKEDPGQARGITHGVAVLRKLKMLDDFDETELVIAKDEACTVRTYTAPANQDSEITNMTTEEAGQLVMDKEPGQAEVLTAGWSSEVQTPKHPNREVTAFKKTMLRDIASGLNLEYANFANDWGGVNYSSVRAGTISERDAWKSDQELYIQQNKSPVFLAWLTSFLSLSISQNFPVTKFDKFTEHIFRGRRWDWVDPLKDRRAAEIDVKHGWKTDGQVTAELTTEDFDNNVEEIKRLDDVKKGSSLEVIKNEKTAQIKS